MIDVGQNLCSVSCFTESYPALSRAACTYRAACGIVAYDAGKRMAQRIALALTYGKPTIGSSGQRTQSISPDVLHYALTGQSAKNRDVAPNIEYRIAIYLQNGGVAFAVGGVHVIVHIVSQPSFRHPNGA